VKERFGYDDSLDVFGSTRGRLVVHAHRASLIRVFATRASNSALKLASASRTAGLIDDHLMQVPPISFWRILSPLLLLREDAPRS